jgi:hypothetical protein
MKIWGGQSCPQPAFSRLLAAFSTLFLFPQAGNDFHENGRGRVGVARS